MCCQSDDNKTEASIVSTLGIYSYSVSMVSKVVGYLKSKNVVVEGQGSIRRGSSPLVNRGGRLYWAHIDTLESLGWFDSIWDEDDSKLYPEKYVIYKYLKEVDTSDILPEYLMPAYNSSVVGPLEQVAFPFITYKVEYKDHSRES